MRRSHKVYGVLLAAGVAAVLFDRVVIGYAGGAAEAPGAGGSGVAERGVAPVERAATALDALERASEETLARRLARSAPDRGPVGALFSASSIGWNAPEGGSAAGPDPRAGPAVEPPALTLTSVSLGERPIAVFRDSAPARVGDEVADGWRIASIDRAGVTVRRDDRTHTYPLPGAGATGVAQAERAGGP